MPRVTRPPLRLWVVSLAVAIGLGVSGCRSHLNDSVLELDAATAPVIDQAKAAYDAANDLHNLRIDYDAVAQFDATDPVYNPRKQQVLLSEKDIGVRLEVLEGFQLYVKTLCAITSGTSPKELGEASASVGGELSTMVNSLAPSVEGVLGIASSDSGGSSTATPVITPEVQNGISTGIYALGKFLISVKVKNELPGKIAEMDPHVQALAKLLESDIDVLQDQERRDYDRIINLQTLYIRKNSETGPEQRVALGPAERRAEILKLPEIVRKQRTADGRLTTLRAALVLLGQAHQELTATAQGKNPESFNEKLQDLANAAQDLGTFYQSLSSSQ